MNKLNGLFSEQQCKEDYQRNWRLPELIIPEDPVNRYGDEQINHGVITSDAALYTTTVNDGEHHCFLKMPSCLDLPSKLKSNTGKIFNLLMIDTSSSMSCFLPHVIHNWNEKIAPTLEGRTSIYTFDTDVILKSVETTYIPESCWSSGCTDLTGAIQKMAEEVYTCKEKNINVFLVTDGQHNETNIHPDHVLGKLLAPPVKIVNVFILALGCSFPVQYSITLRSLLHNGSPNIPSIFWAKTTSEVNQELTNMKYYCCNQEILNKVELLHEGFSLPYTEPSRTFHLGEWVYFPGSCDNLTTLHIRMGSNNGVLMLSSTPASPDLLLNTIFRQWNSILIQLHKSKKPVSNNVIPLMENLFKAVCLEGLCNRPTSINTRMANKNITTYKTQFRTLMNNIKDIMTEQSFSNEMHLAETILNTTVVAGKYKTKVLKLKGHTDDDFMKDGQEFLRVLNKNKDAIKALVVTPDDCCRVMLTSTLSDLQDEDFPRLLNELNKFEFLKEFTISGIGVTIPMRDSTNINPWTLSIDTILGPLFDVVSQKAMEFSATAVGTDKNIQLTADASLNAVIPVFPTEVAETMGAIMATRIYALCATFSILKNPHFIDFDVHFAALGVLWVRLIHDNPASQRPEHVSRKIENIVATAKLYLGRKGYSTYWKTLKENTPLALMTQGSESLKCESIIKPMFILHLMRLQEKVEEETVVRIVETILLEYVGRCLSKYKISEKNATPFTDFFVADQANLLQNTMDDFFNTTEIPVFKLKDYYTKEKVDRDARIIARSKADDMKDLVVKLNLDTEKVKRLRKMSTAGNVSWSALYTFACELGLPQKILDRLFSKEAMTTYVVHALFYRQSSERQTKSLISYQEAIDKATRAVQFENKALVNASIMEKIVNRITETWLSEYVNIHSSEVVQPMTKEEVVAEATKRGVEVSMDTFDQVYRRYRPATGLLGNACQVRTCPFFLQPERTYNQHLSVERLYSSETVIHAVHKTAHFHCNDTLEIALDSLKKGIHRHHPRGSQKPQFQENVSAMASALADLMLVYKSKQ